ncbi:cell wall-binding repeat-containing protein [Egibacter rhizosphaerae]|uniref:Cell wall-binding repeat-containing protein n=1 Tax=Egibacter rhizosphaerae TaxID=1670831 RepID=A0A411YHX4_9ACTN|nr:cell wall-binding repeat-containing protein [Egibacter rhizosphaerae]QBI20721.1 cell wall-binding repeat-containing protein [Egibacter rhizosphaerae]
MGQRAASSTCTVRWLVVLTAGASLLLQGPVGLIPLAPAEAQEVEAQPHARTLEAASTAEAAPALELDARGAGRLSGDDRYATAARIASAAFPDGVDEAVVATGENFPDALAASGLAGRLDAPVLLTMRDRLPASTAEALATLDVETVHVIGGNAAVAPAVATDLDARGYTAARHAGADRYETAAEIATTFSASDTAIVATGENFPDALAGGPLAFAGPSPVLLVGATVPAATEAALDELGISEVVILGGPAAVSESVEARLAEVTGDAAPRRLAGDDRYETAAEVARYLVDETGGVDGDHALVANGVRNLGVDALAGGPYGGAAGAPLLLLGDEQVPAATGAWLTEQRPGTLEALGGPAVVSDAVFADALELAGIDASGPAPGAEPLACEQAGYPCSWAEADPAILDASVDLALDADARHRDGDALGEVADWLADRADVEAVASGEASLMFRLAGGRPTWVVADEPVGPPDAATATSAPTQPDAPTTASTLPAEPRGVAGDDPDEKSALVLSPYAWDFDQSEGEQVAALLGGTRGYGSVTYHENVYDTSANEARLGVTAADYQSIPDHDVVHLDTHGSYACDDGDCYTRVSTGLDIGDLERDVFTGEVIEVSGGRTGSALSADTFRAMPDTGPQIVFINACETYSGSDLAGALTTGRDTVFLGWDAAVDSADAADAATRFYTDLAERGVTTEEALDTLRDEGLAVDRDGAELRRAEGREDLRLREVATLLASDGTELASTDGLTLGGDDQDVLEVTVEVEGVLPDPGERSDYTVRLEVDGQRSPTSYRLDAAQASRVGDIDGAAIYRVDGAWQLPAGVDTSAPLDLEAVVDLPDGGESRHRVEGVSVAGCWYTVEWSGAGSGSETWVYDDASDDIEDLLSLILVRSDDAGDLTTIQLGAAFSSAETVTEFGDVQAEGALMPAGQTGTVTPPMSHWNDVARFSGTGQLDLTRHESRYLDDLDTTVARRLEGRFHGTLPPDDDEVAGSVTVSGEFVYDVDACRPAGATPPGE